MELFGILRELIEDIIRVIYGTFYQALNFLAGVVRLFVVLLAFALMWGVGGEIGYGSVGNDIRYWVGAILTWALGILFIFAIVEILLRLFFTKKEEGVWEALYAQVPISVFLLIDFSVLLAVVVGKWYGYQFRSSPLVFAQRLLEFTQNVLALKIPLSLPVPRFNPLSPPLPTTGVIFYASTSIIALALLVFAGRTTQRANTLQNEYEKERAQDAWTIAAFGIATIIGIWYLIYRGWSLTIAPAFGSGFLIWLVVFLVVMLLGNEFIKK